MTQYLIFPDLPTAQARSEQQARDLGCDEVTTKYWWSTVSLADGTAAVVIDDTGPYAAQATIKGVTAGLTDAEKAALVATVQLAQLPDQGP